MLFLDLDRFKTVNDTWGHDVGDALLEAFAAGLGHQTRQEDIVARLGGEEFVICTLGANATDANDAGRLAERVLEMTRGLVLPEVDRRHTVSVGIATWHADLSAAELLKRADEACYAAKRGGRDRAVRWSKPA